MIYYIYLHIRKDNLKPFYIGKGKDRRAYSKKSRNNYWQNIVKKHDYKIIFLEENLSENEANIKENYWITLFGRKNLNNGLLVNLTNGGEGASGRPMNNKTKEILLKCNTGRTTSNKQKEIVGNMYKGKFGSDHNRSKKVICLETGLEYGSMSEASRKLNIAISSVSWSIKNKKPIYNMHFQIKE
jgi:hypothetical protein